MNHNRGRRQPKASNYDNDDDNDGSMSRMMMMKRPKPHVSKSKPGKSQGPNIEEQVIDLLNHPTNRTLSSSKSRRKKASKLKMKEKSQSLRDNWGLNDDSVARFSGADDYGAMGTIDVGLESPHEYSDDIVGTTATNTIASSKHASYTHTPTKRVTHPNSNRTKSKSTRWDPDTPTTPHSRSRPSPLSSSSKPEKRRHSTTINTPPSYFPKAPSPPISPSSLLKSHKKKRSILDSHRKQSPNHTPRRHQQLVRDGNKNSPSSHSYAASHDTSLEFHHADFNYDDHSHNEDNDVHDNGYELDTKHPNLPIPKQFNIDDLKWHSEMVEYEPIYLPCRIIPSSSKDIDDKVMVEYLWYSHDLDGNNPFLIHGRSSMKETHKLVSMRDIIPFNRSSGGTTTDISWSNSIRNHYRTQLLQGGKDHNICKRNSGLTKETFNRQWNYLERLLEVAKERNGACSTTTQAHNNYDSDDSEDSDSDDDDDDSQSLEEPYTQAFDLFDEKETNHDDSDSSSAAPENEFLDYHLGETKKNPLDKERFTKKERLRPGDVIEYYDPIFVYGDKRALRQAAVLAVDPKKEPFKLKLSDGGYLYDTTRVKRIKTLEFSYEQEQEQQKRQEDQRKSGGGSHPSRHSRSSSREKYVFVDHPGVIRPINEFKLKKESGENLPSFVHDYNSQTVRAKQIIEQGKNQILEKCKANGFAPLGDIMTTTTSPSPKSSKAHKSKTDEGKLDQGSDSDSSSDSDSDDLFGLKSRNTSKQKSSVYSSTIKNNKSKERSPPNRIGSINEDSHTEPIRHLHMNDGLSTSDSSDEDDTTSRNANTSNSKTMYQRNRSEEKSHIAKERNHSNSDVVTIRPTHMDDGLSSSSSSSSSSDEDLTSFLSIVNRKKSMNKKGSNASGRNTFQHDTNTPKHLPMCDGLSSSEEEEDTPTTRNSSTFTKMNTTDSQKHTSDYTRENDFQNTSNRKSPGHKDEVESQILKESERKKQRCSAYDRKLETGLSDNPLKSGRRLTSLSPHKAFIKHNSSLEDTDEGNYNRALRVGNKKQKWSESSDSMKVSKKATIIELSGGSDFDRDDDSNSSHDFDRARLKNMQQQKSTSKFSTKQASNQSSDSIAWMTKDGSNETKEMVKSFKGQHPKSDSSKRFQLFKSSRYNKKIDSISSNTSSRSDAEEARRRDFRNELFASSDEDN